MDVCDLSGPEPLDPQAALALDVALTDAHRGCDIATLSQVSWAVCKLCDRATQTQPRSSCCRAPTRIQGWALLVVRSGHASRR